MADDDEAKVLAANEAFYAAFDAGDAAAMAALWAEKAPVVCVHPGWDPLHGRAAVVAAWHGILDSGRSPRVRAEDARAVVWGDVAAVVCVERIVPRRGVGQGLLAATNVFVREDGAWRVAHHHASPVSRDREPEPPPPGALN